MYVAMDRATSARLFVSMRVESVVHGVLCVCLETLFLYLCPSVLAKEGVPSRNGPTRVFHRMFDTPTRRVLGSAR